MKVQYLILLYFIVEKSFGFKSNHQIDRHTKSIFSNKKYKESFTPARYKVGMKNINFENIGCEKMEPERYFPEVEFPSNTMEASKPFFYKTGESNTMLGPFPDDVQSSYKSLLDKNREAFNNLKTKYINDIENLNARNCIQENMQPILKIETIEEAEASFEEVNVEIDEEVNENVSQSSAETAVDDIAIEENELTDISIESDEVISNDNVEYLEPETQVVEENNEEVISDEEIQSWESEQLY